MVTSFVTDVLMPPIGLLLGKVDFSNLFINLSGKSFESLADAKKAGAATLNYGLFFNTTIDFLIVGFAIFILVRQVNRLKREAPAAGPGDPRVSFLRDRHPRQGHPLPALHVRSDRGISHRARGPRARYCVNRVAVHAPVLPPEVYVPSIVLPATRPV